MRLLLRSSPQLSRRDRPAAAPVRAEQVAALFRSVTSGVIGAASASVILVAQTIHLGSTPPERGWPFAAYISFWAVAHIGLRSAYLASPDRDVRASTWAAWFTAICLFEGVGWGWSSLGLITDGRFDIEMLVMVVTYAIAAASITAFGAFLPAFFAFFLPTVVPFAVASTLATTAPQQASALLACIYIGAMSVLGVRANNTFNLLVGLRLETQALANDLRIEKDVAEQASLAKSTFLAAASHDLRQPVHALGLFVGALRATRLPPEARRLIDQIDESVVAMDHLFVALLDISRLDAGTVEVHPEAFAIQPMLDRICRDHAAEAAGKAIRIRRQPCSAVVFTDPVLMERVLRNLVANAVRYTDTGGVVVGCRRSAGGLSVEVWDTGRGIPEGLQHKVFQEYYQLGNSERDRTKGLGLGLAIVRRLTGLLGCEVALCSIHGVGSRFSVRLPLADARAVAVKPAQETPLAAPTGGLIVVVDDEAAIREAMSSLLVGWGYDVIAAGGGDEIVALLADCPVKPDLIICDYRLRTGENGIDVIERLQSEYNEAIPAMLVTGDTAPDRLAEAEASGLLLLHKPVARSKLRAGITNLMALARL